MNTRGLLFIPDISGFTRFVTATEINHSRSLIQELLEVLIDANHIGLEVSEIEGDAVLFFRYGERPDLWQLNEQVERMFRAFHERLKAYDVARFCQCRACVSASELTLKIITHYGEFTSYHVKQFNKLIGRDVIVAHQLLKNDIDHHEYWLVTAALLPEPPQSGLARPTGWSPGVKHTESGDIAYHYTSLGELKQNLPPAPVPELGLENKTRVLAASREYDAHIITMLHAVGNFTYRSRWQDGVRSVEEVDHFLPRIGTRCRRVMDNGEVVVYASNYSFQPERVVFGETDEGRTEASFFTLEQIEPYRTRLTVEFYIRKGAVRELLFKLRQGSAQAASLQKSLANLESVVKEIDVPVEY
jgi:hypothetical protein